MDERFFKLLNQLKIKYPKIFNISYYITIFSVKTYFLFYGLICFYFIYTFAKFQDKTIIKITLIPLFCYLTNLSLRKIIARKRPFLSTSFNVDKRVAIKKSFSMPSNHATSAFIISFCALLVNTKLGVLSFFIATLTALSRVLCGVHFLSDILLSIFVAFLFGTALLFI